MNALLIGASLISLFGGSPSGGRMEDRDLGFVEIREPNNLADDNGYGAVAYAYRITENLIDNELYARFLNSVDEEGTNPRNLYNQQMGLSDRGGIGVDAKGRPGRKYVVKPGFGRLPVVFVNWMDAARFTNWIRNGGGKGSSTEFGAYNLREFGNQKRKRQGNYWIPCENEIYKAGFYLPLGRGKTQETALYSRISGDGEIVGAGGAVNVRLSRAWINELVDLAMEPPILQNARVWFAGRMYPEAETAEVGFRLAAALTSEVEEDSQGDGDSYAGGPGPEQALSLPTFFGSGAGGGNPPDQPLPSGPPPAS